MAHVDISSWAISFVANSYLWTEMKKHSKEQVEATANAIKDHFIPKDPNETSLSFHFTIPPSSNYKVSYEKNSLGKWIFSDFTADENS